MEFTQVFVQAFYVYLLLGVAFAFVFLWRGAAVLDESAKGISWKTRLLLIPGSVALWPLLLQKWLLASKKSSQNP